MSRNTGGALSPEKYYQLGKSSPASSSKGSSYIRNTVLIANQLLDSIEKDVKLSKNAVESKDRYISQLENENATLCAQLIESKSQIKELQAKLYEKEQELLEFESKTREEFNEIKQGCDSELERVLQQIQQREIILKQNEDILFQHEYQLRELHKALEQSENSKEMINNELQMMIKERKEWIEKIEQTERFCSTIATAHQELTLRCEYLQQRIQVLTSNNTQINSTSNTIFQSKIHNDSLSTTFSKRKDSNPTSMRHRPPPPPPIP